MEPIQIELTKDASLIGSPVIYESNRGGAWWSGHVMGAHYVVDDNGDVSWRFRIQRANAGRTFDKDVHEDRIVAVRFEFE